MPDEESRLKTSVDLTNEPTGSASELPEGSDRLLSPAERAGSSDSSRPAVRHPALSWQWGLFVLSAALFTVVLLGRNESVQLWWLRQRSVEELETTVKQNETSPWPAYVLGLKYAQQGRMVDAVHLLERARDGAPRSFDVRLTLGKADIFAGRLIDALSELQEAAKLAPSDARVYLFMGMAQRLIGQFPEARQSEQKATGMDPDNAEAWYQYGICFSPTQGDENSGLPFLKRAAELQPMNPVYQFAYGRGLADTTQFAAAIPPLRKAAAQIPGNPLAHFLLGLSLHRKGGASEESAEALSELNRALAIKPNDRNAHYEIGLIREEAGDFEQAQKEFETTVGLDPTFGEVYFHLQKTAQRLGRMDEAKAAGEKFGQLRRDHLELEGLVRRLEANPEDIAGHLRAGALLEKQLSWQAAAAQYGEILSRHPDNHGALEAMQKLKERFQKQTGPRKRRADTAPGEIR